MSEIEDTKQRIQLAQEIVKECFPQNANDPQLLAAIIISLTAERLGDKLYAAAANIAG